MSLQKANRVSLPEEKANTSSTEDKTSPFNRLRETEAGFFCLDTGGDGLSILIVILAAVI